MARKTSTPTLRSAGLSPPQMHTAISRLEVRVKELQEFDVDTITEGDGPEVKGLEARIRSTLAQVFGENTHEFARLGEAFDLDRTAYAMNINPFADGPSTTVAQIREGVNDGRKRAIALLQAEVGSLREAIEYAQPAATEAPLASAPVARSQSTDVFVVHGHDELAKVEVARLIERTGLKAVILHEQANSGRTIMKNLKTTAVPLDLPLWWSLPTMSVESILINSGRAPDKT